MSTWWWNDDETALVLGSCDPMTVAKFNSGVMLVEVVNDRRT